MDIWVPLTKRPVNDAATFRAGRLFALMWGVVLTGGALLYSREPHAGGRRRTVNRVVHVLARCLARFSSGFSNLRAAKQRDAILGMSVGIVAIRRSSCFRLLFKIAWPWYVLIGTTITLFTGSLSALRTPVIKLR